MIVTKASLSAVKVARRDKDLPVLDNVRIEKDGTTVACARNIVLAISPPGEARAAEAPVGSTGPLTRDLTIPSEYVKGVLKEVKTDKTFDGLLEYVDVHELHKSVSDGAFTWIEDGCPKTLRFDVDSSNFIDYRSVFTRSLNDRSGVRLKMNRVRLKALVDTLDKVAPDNGEAPVYIEFTEAGDMIMRATNDKTGQRAVAVMTRYSERGGDWLDPDEWERGLCDGSEGSGNDDSANSVHRGRRRAVRSRMDTDTQSQTARRPLRTEGTHVSRTIEEGESGSSKQERRRTVRSGRTDVRSSTSVRRVDGRTESGTKQCARVARRERKR